MKKVLGYAAALIAALSLGGAVATAAHADGAEANAASGISSSSTSSDTYIASLDTSTTTPAAPAESSTPASSDSSSAVASSSSSSASSSSAVATHKPGKKPIVVSSSKKLRGRLHYKKYSRVILFQKGRKGFAVTLRNRKGQFVKKFVIKRSGRFSIKLTRKEAEKLGKYGKHFDFTVSKKGYKTYTIKYLIYK